MTLKKLTAAAALFAFSAGAIAAGIPTQKFDKALHDQLPAQVQKSGVLRNAVLSGAFPPYTIISPEKRVEGAQADFAKALSEILGVRIEHVLTASFPAVLMGLQANRFDLSIGPTGDFPKREAKNDFVDYVQEYVVFAVRKGNPLRINGLEDICGKRIAVMSGGSAERVIRQASEACVKEKKPAATVQSYDSQSTSALSVRSGRSDAFFSSQAPLTYFVSQNKNFLELAATGKKNGFGDLYQGVTLPKDSPLTKPVLGAFQILFRNGTYKAILEKHGLHENAIAKPGKNLGGAAAK